MNREEDKLQCGGLKEKEQLNKRGGRKEWRAGGGVRINGQRKGQTEWRGGEGLEIMQQEGIIKDKGGARSYK